MTWPFPDDQHFAAILGEQEGMPFWEDIDFELDLMVADAVSNFNIYTKLGPKRIIFHLGAQKNIEEFEQTMNLVYLKLYNRISILKKLVLTLYFTKILK